MVTIPVARHRVHIVGETLGLWVAGPIAIYASTYKTLPKWLRVGLFAAGVGTMAVDAWLLREAARAH